MKIYFLRHGQAEEREPGRQDKDRPLTSYGASVILNMAYLLRKEVKTLDLILTSPMLRSVQSADIVGNLLECKGKIVQSDSLLIESAPQELLDEIKRHRQPKTVLVVGHEPHLGACVSFLSGKNGHEVRLEKGGLSLVEIHELKEGGGKLSSVREPIDSRKEIPKK
jgi:phosphohistidine phosphatase